MQQANADQKILAGLNKAERRRYSSFLQALGVELKVNQKSNTEEDPSLQENIRNPNVEQNQHVQNQLPSAIEENHVIQQEQNEKRQDEVQNEIVILQAFNDNIQPTFTQEQEKKDQILFQNENYSNLVLQQVEMNNNASDLGLNIDEDIRNHGERREEEIQARDQVGGINFQHQRSSNVFDQPFVAPKMEIQTDYEPQYQSQSGQILYEVTNVFSGELQDFQPVYHSNKNLIQEGQIRIPQNQEESRFVPQINLEFISRIYTPASAEPKPCIQVEISSFDCQIETSHEFNDQYSFINEIDQLVREEANPQNTFYVEPKVDENQIQQKYSEIQMISGNEFAQQNQQNCHDDYVPSINPPMEIEQNYFTSSKVNVETVEQKPHGNVQISSFEQKIETRQEFNDQNQLINEIHQFQRKEIYQQNTFYFEPQVNEHQIQPQQSETQLISGNEFAQQNQQNLHDDYIPSINPPMEIEQNGFTSNKMNNYTIEQKSQSENVQNEIHQPNSKQNIFDTPQLSVSQKAQSQFNDNGKVQSVKSKKNSVRMGLSNCDVSKSASSHESRRKFSDTFRSVGLSSVGNKIFSNRKGINSQQTKLQENQIHQHQININQPPSLEQENRILEVEQHPQVLSIFKKTPTPNCFSNRSQGSHRSNHSNKSKSSHSSYRYNRFVDTMQVPELTSLQIVKDGRQSRVERRSSLSSHHSRSASTCKKSYEDLSDIQMHKIDESVCEELDEKSVKRSVHNIRPKMYPLQENLNQKLQLQRQFSQQQPNTTKTEFSSSNQIKNTRQSDFHYFTANPQSQESKKKEQQKQTAQFDLGSVQQQQQLNEKQSNTKRESHNQKISHQVSYHYGDSRKLEFDEFSNKSVQMDGFSEDSSQKTTQSMKFKKETERKEKERQFKIERMTQVQVVDVLIESPLEISQRLEVLIRYCREFFQTTHNNSNYEKEQFRLMLVNYFELLGIELNPINQLGLRLHHDGIFACSYIRYVKGARNNSGMIESMLYTQFEEEVKIETNSEYFQKELKRVKEEREMHYQNQFEKRLKQYEEKKSNEQEKRINLMQNQITQMKDKLQQQQRRQSENKVKIQKNQNQKIQVKSSRDSPEQHFRSHRVEEKSQSNISPAGSSGTLTVDESSEFDTSIRKSKITEFAPHLNNLIAEENQDIEKTEKIQNLTQTVIVTGYVRQELPKKSEKPRRRYTKKKENKKVEQIVITKVQESSDFEQTISHLKHTQTIQIPKLNQDVPSTTKNQNDQTYDKGRQTKGILKAPRHLKEDEEKRKKNQQSRKSTNRNSQEKKSPPKRNKSLNKGAKQSSGSHQTKNQQKSKHPNKSRNSTDIQQTDVPVSNVSKSKVRFEESVNEMTNQGKMVKFTNSTKGGDTPSSNQSRANSKMSETQSGEGKRNLRSRSKKN